MLRLRGSGVMWQKERLLNIAAPTLPASCTKIAWLDNDVLFENPNWVQETSDALETSFVVQPFDWAVRLPQGVSKFDGRGETYESYANVFVNTPRIAQAGEFFRARTYRFRLGSAARAFRALRPVRCLPDRQRRSPMAHGFAGGMKLSPCLPRVIGRQPHYAEHFVSGA